MKLPNKVNRYKTTIVYQMAEILSSINKDMLPTEIYMMVSTKMNAKEFYDGLSALFAIRKIEYLEDGRIRKY
jgi:hypothetical protein